MVHSNKSIIDEVSRKDHAHDLTPSLQQESSKSCSSYDTSQPATSGNKTMSTRMYSARLTRHKPQINGTNEYAWLIYKWSLLDNILHKKLKYK